MTVAFPWSGRDFNALVPMSGRAAVPNTPAGTGFNWPSLTGRISGYIRPVRGWGMSGLGQDGTSSVDLTTLYPASPDTSSVDLTTLYPALQGTLASTAAGGASSASSQAPWWANLLSTSITSGLKVGSQIASYELNPLTSKATYYQTPQGAVYASNVPTSGIPGLTTGTASSLLPLLLIGGVVMMFMMGRRQ